jgi:uncharacterized protein Yka (UPF0111/DUF47 family)
MEERIDIEDFLKEMISIISKRFEKCEQLIESIQNEIENLKANGQEMENLKLKVKELEKLVTSSKRASIDRSVLKVLEGKF